MSYLEQVSENLKHFRSEDKIEFTKNAKIVYKRAIGYLNKNFDFIESPFKLFSALNLDSELNFEYVVKISEKLNIWTTYSKRVWSL